MKKKNSKTNGFLHAFESFVDKYKIFVIIGGLALLVVAPFVAPNDYVIRIMCVMGMYATYGFALNILLGEMGLMSLGQAGFIGIGAYTASILMVDFGINFLIASLAGAVMAAVFGLLIGLPTLRLSGSYLAIVTIGFGEIMRMIFLNWVSVTGGALGIKSIPRPKIFGIEMTYKNYGFYFLIIAIAILVGLFCWSLHKSKYGRAFATIKQDELAAKMMGIETIRYKIMGFVLSAAICGFMGSYYAMMQRYIDANSFTGDMSIMIVSVVVTGALGTLRGPALGAVLLVALPEVFRGLQEYRFIVYGLLLIIMMRVRPAGILGWKSTLPYKLPKGTKELIAQHAKEKGASSEEPEKGDACLQ